MQGSRIAHAVTPVVRAREPRLTVVNSYAPLNPFAADRTIYVAFRDVDSEQRTYGYEFARHVAWRVAGQLEHLVGSGEALMGRDSDVVTLLANAEAELGRAKELISGRRVDRRPYKTRDGEADEAQAGVVVEESNRPRSRL